MKNRLYLQGKQIRLFVSGEEYLRLKKEAHEFGLTLAQYSGMKLSGFTLKKPAEWEEQQKTTEISKK